MVRCTLEDIHKTPEGAAVKTVILLLLITGINYKYCFYYLNLNIKD